MIAYSFNKLENQRILNIAHRGARSLAPENTLAAVKRGFEEQADLWETDVTITKDGELILFHDTDLTRTTDAVKKFPGRKGWVTSDFTLEELKSLDAGSWFVETDPFGQIKAGVLTQEELESYREEKIPTLDEALTFTRNANWPVKLELKELNGSMKGFPMVDRVLDTVKNLAIDENRIVISSFCHGWLREVQKKSPQIRIQALIGDTHETELNWGDLEFETYNANHELITEDKIREMKQKNITVNLFTVNCKEDMVRFSNAGAAGIITDFPQHLRELKNSASELPNTKD